ncbi:V-type proton ATPase subunit G1-like [Ipomoea triloba]|uniref:V-type proton ATPase subunit G1-like n=1 Tax=Ipomoea triloba TaxID=35885 RepID=UPI00125D9F6E|nr:V-type proton ATPase subunit G1-like [Ipomoea triloba]GMD51106.1 V-type proton ATPase subunit G-like [Ipomoea batatas]
MDTMKAQGGIQMLLNAEQDAQQIIASARNVKMARLRQAHDEAEREVTNYRTQLEADYQKQISECSGSSDSSVKRLEAETDTRIRKMKEASSRVSPDVVSMLIRHITTVRT